MKTIGFYIVSLVGKVIVKNIRKENYDLLDADYEYIILHGRVTDRSTFDKLHISIENVDNLEELKDTNLHNIPILYVVDKESVSHMQDELRTLQNRPDISAEQLFFRISPALSEEKVVREISDLGITAPNVVMSADDPIIIKYFELFPFTDFIRDTIKLFKKHILMIRDGLNAETNVAKSENVEQHHQIELLDLENAKLKEALDKFVKPDRTDFSVHFISTVEETKDKINTWRNNKTKITQPEEAVRVARELDNYFQEVYQDYLRKMHLTLIKSAKSVQVQMHAWYEIASADMGFIPGRIAVPDYAFDRVPSIQNELLKIKEESYVTPKEDFLGRFFRPASDSGTEPVLETTFYYAWWRTYLLSKLEPYLYKVYNTCIEKLESYFDQLGNVYKEHLQMMIEDKEYEKSILSSHLSEAEQLLQNDNDWLIQFSDKVKVIARE